MSWRKLVKNYWICHFHTEKWPHEINTKFHSIRPFLKRITDQTLPSLRLQIIEIYIQIEQALYVNHIKFQAMQALAPNLSGIYIQHLKTVFLCDFHLIFGDFSKNISRNVNFKTSFISNTSNGIWLVSTEFNLSRRRDWQER